MKITKRILSTILLVALLVGMVPTNANAVESSSTVQSGQTTVVGNNSFGALLSDDIQEQEAEDSENYSGGYNVTGLTVENSVATVEYDTLEKAVLVVSLYSEDGLQLLVSANTVVQPENNIATVTLNGSIPEYFMASAYLLDTYDYSPLCAAYDTPMYTKEMQDLLVSTTDDYDQDKILNLDSSKDTNFAVYADTTKVLEYKAGVNNVISADDETATYVIGNADSNITGLKSGDILAYSYGENQVLIVKVATLSMDGTTATIAGAELEMEEVFSHVKVESKGNTEDITVDEATGDDDITYVGMISDDASVMATRNAYAVNPTGDYTGKLSLGFELEQESGSIKYSGSLTLNLKVDFSYYVSTSRQFVELEIDTQTKLAFKISGEAELTKKLPNLNFSPIPAVSVGFKPELVLKFTAEVELSLSVGSKTGFSYENGKGVQDLSTSPKVQMDLDVEGKVFFGLDLGPAVWVLDGHIAEIKFSALAGIELKGEMGGANFDDFQLVGGKEVKDSIHTCESCLEISLSAKIEFSLKLKFLNLSFLKFDFKLTDKVFDIGEAYYSFDLKEFGWGSCPNKSYHVTVYVQNAQGQDAFGVDVIAGWAENLTEIPLGKTNSNGVLEYYLQGGTYTFMATVDGENLGKMVLVEESCKVTLDKASIGGTPTFISGIINPDLITDNGIVASGECGASGADVTWTLYGSGLMNIAGSGDMAAFSSTSNIPWYNYANYISSVVIDEGVTSVGSRAFYNCTNLKQVDLPESILAIGARAFYKCSSLSEIEIPQGVSTINSYTFYDCTNLRKVTLNENITSIKDRAFSGCESLGSITIPNKTTFFGYYAFYNCDNLSKVYISDIEAWCGATFDGYYSNPVNNDGYLYLNGSLVTSITLPKDIPTVSEYLFHGCLSITKVVIPEGVTEIGAHAFESCDNLETVSIPSTVTTIGGYAFCGSGITSLVIPDAVEKIPDLLCQWCENLTRLVVGQNVTYIGTDAFAFTDLEEIVFRGDAPTTIKYGAFRTISPTGYYPMDNATWTSFIENYSGNITWVAYATAPFTLDAVIASQDLYSADVEVASAEECLEQSTEGGISLFSIWEGEYGTEITEQYTLKTASFTGLVPGEQYLLLALVSIETDSILTPENLLYIDQGVATEDGTLTFTYAQREVTDTSYVMACGASHNDLNDAVVTFPAMLASDQVQAVHPKVVYNGETLVEGIDYVVVGTVAYTAAGQYTCYVRGIYNYSGLVQCQYTVADKTPGDVNGDGVVDTLDRMVLSRYLANWDEYDEASINITAADVNGDGVVDTLDRMVLNRYLANWDGYEDLPYAG